MRLLFTPMIHGSLYQPDGAEFPSMRLPAPSLSTGRSTTWSCTSLIDRRVHDSPLPPYPLPSTTVSIVKTIVDPLPFSPQRIGQASQTDKTGRALKRAALLNAIAMVASNFRAIFTLLIARLLGAAALGIFSVAWATADLISKIGICGLDDAVTTFVGRAEAVGDRNRSRIYFRIANLIAVVQSAIVADVLSLAIPHIGAVLALDRQLTGALAVIVWALPGIAAYRVSTSVSRGLKVMQHDIYSRGLTEPGITTIAFLIAMPLGAGAFAPEAAAVVGSSVSGIVALFLAASLFGDKSAGAVESIKAEAYSLVRYAVPIGGDQFLNAFIWRVDVIILGSFVGRAPGVTLTTLGVYGAVVGLANGLRRVSQPFTPIFAPVVAGMTSIGAHAEAAKTYSRLLQWMLWILVPATAVMILAGKAIMMVYGSG